MSQAIHQMQVRYIPAEDRLLFRLNTRNQEEFRFWLTRRYSMELWKALLHMLDGEQAPQMLSQTPQAKQAVRAFQHEQVLNQADMETPYKEHEENMFPLGEEPVLLSRIKIKTTDKQRHILCLHPATGKGLDLALDGNLLHSFCHLLSQGASQTNWGLRFKLAETVSPETAAPH
ncbi:hypothetical protein [Candidatus Venteria ishoeyi]|uniref:Uncharacterized protein n=1 Tax=Candidatus Venteria ishoeyi TaxID=1899563 RepID=A0A1H6FGH1_9GAMM|nr:hypothetical protein [Candidatus Venteria ishoeyi]MDM8544889.1 hypothetical protein [Candidatus Venteria ishoeyi]SEH08521.1 Uncharacterised protein [Candidatus Venteria ishoeyi]